MAATVETLKVKTKVTLNGVPYTVSKVQEEKWLSSVYVSLTPSDEAKADSYQMRALTVPRDARDTNITDFNTGVKVEVQLVNGGGPYIVFKGHRYVVRTEGKTKYIQTTSFGKVKLSDVKKITK